jgi:hypothetical protein
LIFVCFNRFDRICYCSSGPVEFESDRARTCAPPSTAAPAHRRPSTAAPAHPRTPVDCRPPHRPAHRRRTPEHRRQLRPCIPAPPRRCTPDLRIAALRAAARRSHHPHAQVNLPRPSVSAADDWSPPPSSAFVPFTARARRRDSADGVARRRYQTNPLAEAELPPPPPRAAVAGVGRARARAPASSDVDEMV